MVGALVVSRGRVVGTGYHRRVGGPHAEVEALRRAGARARGATLYVSLEPCAHTEKRTPPCAPAIVSARLRRVVIPTLDPNPRVQGRGVRFLRRAGVMVAIGCLRDEAERVNRIYSHRMRTGRPYVTLKAAATLDGKIATATGASQWITGEAARKHVHRVRSRVDAIMVGIETVLRDNPRLTVRLPVRPSTRRAARQPARVVVDSHLRLPLAARVLKSGRRGSLIVATSARASKRRVARLRKMGVTVLVLPMDRGRVSLRACLEHLRRVGITSVLLEGGSELNASALRAGLVNRIMLYLAPRLLGGQDAKGIIGGRSVKTLQAALPLTELEVKRIGRDLLIEALCAPNAK